MDVNKNIKWKIHYYFSWADPFIVETNIVSSRHLIYVASFPARQQQDLFYFALQRPIMILNNAKT